MQVGKLICLGERDRRRTAGETARRWRELACFGGAIGSVLGGGQAISAGAVHVEDVAAARLGCHDAHGSARAQQAAHQICLHHLLDLLRPRLQE